MSSTHHVNDAIFDTSNIRQLKVQPKTICGLNRNRKPLDGCEDTSKGKTMTRQTIDGDEKKTRCEKWCQHLQRWKNLNWCKIINLRHR